MVDAVACAFLFYDKAQRAQGVEVTVYAASVHVETLTDVVDGVTVILREQDHEFKLASEFFKVHFRVVKCSVNAPSRLPRSGLTGAAA